MSTADFDPLKTGRVARDTKTLIFKEAVMSLSGNGGSVMDANGEPNATDQ